MADSVQFTSLLDRMALDYLKDKRLKQGFSHYDVWLYEHAVNFTVAKMMDADLLAETKSALEDALQNGTDFATFKQRLKPYLMAKGWWGESVMIDPQDGIAKTVQLGSTRRLRVIFQTNTATAYAAGQWARIQEDAERFPYLKYIASTAEHKRQSHTHFYGKIWRADDPIWHSIFPPNGYGCQCTARQLSAKQALRERGEDIARQPEKFTPQQIANQQRGIIDDGTDWIEWRNFTNPRTGQSVRVPFDVSPSFAHNPGQRLEAVQALAAEKHGDRFLQKLLAKLQQYLAKRQPTPETADLSSSANIIAAGKALYEKYAHIMKQAIANGKPHEGIAEIMRQEGVELGGEVLAYSSNPETVSDLVEALKIYPKSWIEKSNAMGRVLVEDNIGRAWHTLPDVNNLDFVKIMRTRPKSWAAGAERFQWAFKGRKMAFQQGDSLLLNNAQYLMSPDKSLYVSTQVHEFAHRLQRVFPDLDALFTRLWQEKTKNDPVQTLREMTGNRNYRQDEKGKPDHFPNPYYGKMYGNEDDPKPLEMMTMIFESLLGGNLARYQELVQQEDFLHFGLALLVNYRP